MDAASTKILRLTAPKPQQCLKCARQGIHVHHPRDELTAVPSIKSPEVGRLLFILQRPRRTIRHVPKNQTKAKLTACNRYIGVPGIPWSTVVWNGLLLITVAYASPSVVVHVVGSARTFQPPGKGMRVSLFCERDISLTHARMALAVLALSGSEAIQPLTAIH